MSRLGKSVIDITQIPTWNSSATTSNLSSRISLWQGDITQLKIDAIVNAANTFLRGGGGVDGAIHSAAGPQLLDACYRLGGCPTGSAKITPGFRLPAKCNWVMDIIHCVGPIGENKEALRSTYHKALELCTEHHLKTVAFPCISTGVFGYPAQAAANVALSTVLSYLKTHPEIERVIFCVFLNSNLLIYKDLIPKVLEMC